MWGSEISNTATSENWLDLLKSDDYLIPLIGLHWLMDGWKLLLFSRQLSLIKKAVIVPPEFVGKMDTAAYKAKRRTAISTNVFLIVLLSAMLIIKTLKLVFNYHAFVWDLTASYGDTLDHRAAWYAAFEEVSDDMVLLPFYLTAHLMFRRKSAPVLVVFITMIIQMFFAAISAAQFMMFLVWITESFGAQGLFYAPLLVNLVGLVFMGIYIHSIVPNNMQKLLSATTDGQLKEQLMAITSGVKYPVDRIYVDDSMTQANAYFMGIFGANMIAVSPMLMRIMNGRSTAACVSHELGHWAHHHNSVLLMFALASVLCMSSGWFFAYDNSIINNTFRFKVAPQAVIPVTLWITYVSTLALDFIAGINSAVGCRCEYTADAFAVPRGLGSALIDGLIALAANSARFPFYDTWYSAWYNHHPTIIQRIRRLNKTQ